LAFCKDLRAERERNLHIGSLWLAKPRSKSAETGSTSTYAVVPAKACPGTLLLRARAGLRHLLLQHDAAARDRSCRYQCRLSKVTTVVSAARWASSQAPWALDEPCSRYRSLLCCGWAQPA